MRYYERGMAMIKQGSIAEARNFLERAADGNSPDAAMELARTYDPEELRKAGSAIFGIVPDAARAKFWYQRAEKLGATDAAVRLRALGN